REDVGEEDRDRQDHRGGDGQPPEEGLGGAEEHPRAEPVAAPSEGRVHGHACFALIGEFRMRCRVAQAPIAITTTAAATALHTPQPSTTPETNRTSHAGPHASARDRASSTARVIGTTGRRTS